MIVDMCLYFRFKDVLCTVPIQDEVGHKPHLPYVRKSCIISLYNISIVESAPSCLQTYDLDSFFSSFYFDVVILDTSRSC
jgi:hypothetical protein